MPDGTRFAVVRLGGVVPASIVLDTADRLEAWSRRDYLARRAGRKPLRYSVLRVRLDGRPQPPARPFSRRVPRRG